MDKNSEAFGITGFILGLLAVLLFQSIGIILAIIGLIFSIIQIKRNKTKLAIAGLVLSIIGIVLPIIMIIIVIVVWQGVVTNVNQGNSQINTQVQCLTINLEIDEVNADTDIMKVTRRPGEGDLDKIRVITNKNIMNDLESSDLEELSEKEFNLNINPGDEIEIAPILKDGTVCSIISTKTA